MGGLVNQAEAQFHVWGIRYQVKDANRSAEFYTRYLGFKVDQQVGATRVVRLCDMLEKRGRAGLLDGIVELAAELRQAVDTALRALQEIRGN